MCCLMSGLSMQLVVSARAIEIPSDRLWRKSSHSFMRTRLRSSCLSRKNERPNAPWNISWTCLVHGFTRTLLK